MTDRPTTETGQWLFLRRHDADGFNLEDATEDDIKRIEAEAKAQERERIAADVMKLRKWDKRKAPGGFHVNRRAVLNVIHHPEYLTDLEAQHEEAQR